MCECEEGYSLFIAPQTAATLLFTHTFRTAFVSNVNKIDEQDLTHSGLTLNSCSSHTHTHTHTHTLTHSQTQQMSAGHPTNTQNALGRRSGVLQTGGRFYYRQTLGHLVMCLLLCVCVCVCVLLSCSYFLTDMKKTHQNPFHWFVCLHIKWF